ncbi:MAG: glutamine--fructose-6-phosphate transaminase (isomerizing) [Acidobacteriia bacterium]|nr:glutamine--fructose-6-phosphate transaminase (isomerizing) [Terriglobia bacterium]
MCGIVGYLGKKRVVPVILDGLKRLEYRGYDSAGIAVVNEGHLEIRRTSGKLRNLEEAIRLKPLDGTYGIGHTRWATHGRPTEENAHPHRDCKGEIVVVHNGIIENYLSIKNALIAEGHRFVTETDTEVIAHLIEKHSNGNLETAVLKTVQEIKGLFALAILSTKDPNKIVAVRSGPPAIVGLGNDEFFVASDVPAVLPHTRDIIFLADGDIAVVTENGVSFMDFKGAAVTHPIQHIMWDPIMAEKGGFKHFMLKEIYEQPRAVRDTMAGRLSLETGKIFLDQMMIDEEEFRRFTNMRLVACGTSWHAALAGKFMLERLARIPVEVDYGSEFRYRNPIITPSTLTMVITQSGETADTIAAQREARQRGSKSLAICNVVGSMVARDSDGTIYTHAGPEIGVASTKAFTAQLTALYLFAICLAQTREQIDEKVSKRLVQELTEIPSKIEKILQQDETIEELSRHFFRCTDFLFLGRGIHYPIALEGALKLKEISYIHAEGYPAGEMKHGPNALIDENLPVVILASTDLNDPESVILREKTMSNVKEVKARDGIVIALGSEGDHELAEAADYFLETPQTNSLLSSILEVVPLQLLAYHIAIRRGCDVDQPRNLAKSVTVE